MGVNWAKPVCGSVFRVIIGTDVGHDLVHFIVTSLCVHKGDGADQDTQLLYVPPTVMAHQQMHLQ
tara:strand:- start:12996 stop:13190 length:195 start_codon:yes stop_codon:yes gene_type:complete